MSYTRCPSEHACLVLSLAAQEITRAEVEAIVKESIAYAKANGKEAALKGITKLGGPFRRHGGELYVFGYDLTGTLQAHGQGASKVGVSQLNSRDPDGVEYIKERIVVANSKGKGWHDYK